MSIENKPLRDFRRFSYFLLSRLSLSLADLCTSLSSVRQAHAKSLVYYIQCDTAAECTPRSPNMWGIVDRFYVSSANSLVGPVCATPIF